MYAGSVMSTSSAFWYSTMKNRLKTWNCHGFMRPRRIAQR
jgi:hypothetical protein